MSDDFLAVSVSGMDSFSLHVGRPFGGCSILQGRRKRGGWGGLGPLTFSPLANSL